MSNALERGFKIFRDHYTERLGKLEKTEAIIDRPDQPAMYTELLYNDLVKEGNGPRILHHGKRTEDVIVLTHGYTDSPYYLQAVALGFLRAGVNVIMPLLPGHGLKEPGNMLEDKSLDTQWRATITNAVAAAAELGERISIGGFSTGGALSLNKILRGGTPEITGGLFLFSAAIGIGSMQEKASGIDFLQSLVKIYDGKIFGEGRDPYKYPQMPNTGGMEVGQIINENNELLREGKEKKVLTQPVFAAHSVHDRTTRFEDLLEFMRDHVENGITMIIAQNIPGFDPTGKPEQKHVEHASLTLDEDIKLNHLDLAKLSEKSGLTLEEKDFEPSYLPIANPHFQLMLDNVLAFFDREVRRTNTRTDLV